MTTPVEGEQSAAVEELVLGPRPGRRLPRWLLLTALALALVLLGAFAVWRSWPQPPAPLTLNELQDAYAGMVRADGVNDASVLSRQSSTPDAPQVSPSTCYPLVQTTAANRFPDAARDGVGTYWLESTWSISLFTLRFDDEAAARAQLAAITAALDECADQHLELRSPDEPDTGVWRATVRRIAESPTEDQLNYAFSVPDGLMVIEVLAYLNTVSWQFRYAEGVTTYVPDPADQLLTGVRHQLEAVVAARTN